MRARSATTVWAAAACAIIASAAGTALAQAGAAPDSGKPIGAPAMPAREQAALPTGGEAAVSPGSLAKTVLSLGVVLGIAVVLAAAAKKVSKSSSKGTLLAQMGPGGPSPSGLLEVLGRYPLTRQQTLVVLRFDRRVLLLAQSKGLRGAATLSTLCEVDDADDVASILLKTQDDEGASAAATFRRLIDRFESRDDGVIHAAPAVPASPAENGRSIQESEEGDRAELLDERTLLFPRLNEEHVTDSDAVGSLRKRLAVMREIPAEGGRAR